MKYLGLVFILTNFTTTGVSNPYPDPDAVPQVDSDFFAPVYNQLAKLLSPEAIRATAFDVLRVRVDWDDADDRFEIAHLQREQSGTSALVARSRTVDELGSYKAMIFDIETHELLAADALGTGMNYRRLTRALSFRFPWVDRPVKFVLYAENPETGIMEEVIAEQIEPETAEEQSRIALEDVDVRELKAPTQSPSLYINVYAEGYSASRQTQFWNDAGRVLTTFQREQIPYWEHIGVRAVFSPSVQSLGSAQNLGLPIPERDSFLGLYFPYWNNFGRWYHVVYPTREERFRSAIATVPYDYPIAIVDSSSYWGVGNYKENTAVPSRNSSFEYLLMHEFGHFLGLNEEYEGGGRTELEFAPGIEEPWSQNMTFVTDANHLKWRAHVSSSTPIPTPSRYWTGNGAIGAYRGGYADSEPRGASHKPGFACTMSSGRSFCSVCEHAIRDRIAFDLGM